MKILNLLSAKKQLNKILFMLALILFAFTVKANNVRVTNDTVIANGSTVYVQFDLAWDNAWRNGITNNWDAVWVFFKHNNNGAWQHLDLTGTNNITGIPSGCGYTVYPDKKGIMIYRTLFVTGNISITGIQVPVVSTPLLGTFDLKIFAIEMVYVPQGSFNAGGTQTTVNSTVPGTNCLNKAGLGFTIGTSTVTPVKCHFNSTADDDTLQNIGVGISGTSGLDAIIGSSGFENPNFPTGYKAFYCMKYEISQGAYRDFLNTGGYITSAFTINNPNFSGSVGDPAFYIPDSNSSYRNSIKLKSISPLFEFGCDADNDTIFDESNDGEWIAMNFLDQGKLLRYLSWACLRPMTELEYEKACRGPGETNLFPFGGTIYNGSYFFGNSNQSNELLQNQFNGQGNCVWSGTSCCTQLNFIGPVRNGIFATSTSSRLVAGATYWGIMEMCGNVAEQTVTIGFTTGRFFQGTHGDGTANNDVFSTFGFGQFPAMKLKGGGWLLGDPRILFREYLSPTATSFLPNLGGRGVRSAF